MTDSELIIIGVGGHAASCVDTIESQGRYRIRGFIGESEEVRKEYLGYPVLGSDSDISRYAVSTPFALVAIGSISNYQARVNMIKKIDSLGFQAPTIVAKTAYLSQHASVGKGTILMHGSIVNAGAIVGDHCIVNSSALIEHNSVVGDYCHVATGVLINGNVRVGVGSFIGSGAVIREGVRIGENCFIGMGQAVIQDLVPGVRATK